MEIAQSLPPTLCNLKRQRQLCSDINNLLENEEIWWKQCSRVAWLQHGDKNTKFFHKKSSQRKQKNYIKGLKDDQGMWKFSFDDLQALMVNFFIDLFKPRDLSGVDRCCNMIKRKIPDHLMSNLSRPFSREDVVHALHSTSPTKTPGPDGYSAIFYQLY